MLKISTEELVQTAQISVVCLINDVMFEDCSKLDSEPDMEKLIRVCSLHNSVVVSFYDYMLIA